MGVMKNIQTKFWGTLYTPGFFGKQEHRCRYLSVHIPGLHDDEDSELTTISLNIWQNIHLKIYLWNIKSFKSYFVYAS